MKRWLSALGLVVSLCLGLVANCLAGELENEFLRDARDGKVDEMRALLDKGVDVNAKNPFGSALTIAAIWGRAEAVRLLLERGANINARSGNGQTALILASSKGFADVVRVLLEKGADANAKDMLGRTALMLASMEGYADTVGILLEKGADVNAKDKDGLPALMLAMMRGHTGEALALIKSGADVNAENANGETALLYAAELGDLEAVRSLIAKGSDVNKKDKAGLTALLYAAQYNHAAIVRFLIQRGADFNVRNPVTGFSAQQYAEQQGDKETLSVLRAKGVKLPASPEKTGGEEALSFNYDYKLDAYLGNVKGTYVRRVRGVVRDPRGLWNALTPLQPPMGAQGAYGRLGDDGLLGKEPGYGLRQLGNIARRYVRFESFYVEQPEGFEDAGVKSGTFTNADDLNDTTLGWIFFDLRPKFEADLKQQLKLAP